MDFLAKKASLKCETPYSSKPFSATEVNDGFELTSKNASNPIVGSDESLSLSTIKDKLSETSPLDKSCTIYEEEGGPRETTMLSKDEIQFLSPYNSFQTLSHRNIPTNDCEDSAVQVQATSSSDERMSRGDETEILSLDNYLQPFSLSNISTSDFEDGKEPETPSSDDDIDYSDYYEDDDDKERYCEQMATAEKMSAAEALKVENEDSASSLPSSEKDCESISKFFLVEEPTENSFIWLETDTQSSGPLDEGELLIQLRKFLLNIPISARETPLANSVTTSRLFSDEFAREHGLTVDEISSTADLCNSTHDSERNQERKPKGVPNMSKNKKRINGEETKARFHYFKS